jgi:adenosylcobinamide-GDP ribazoletransferase
MKKEVRIFFAALMFFTRIPVPSWAGHSPEYLEKSTRYFPLIGLIAGLVSAISFYFSQQVLPNSIAIIMSMIASILLTGAFHEDGLADVCDGFGGGWTKEKILTIMKDSRIGTYGVVGLVMVLLSKYVLSVEISEVSVVYFLYVLFVSHALSRFTAATVIFLFEYARDDASSKTKPLAKRLSFPNYLIAGAFAALPLVLAIIHYSGVLAIVLIPLPLIAYFLGGYFKKWIGGFTGDCLGAVQQISEITIYLMMLGIWKYI